MFSFLRIVICDDDLSFTSYLANFVKTYFDVYGWMIMVREDGGSVGQTRRHCLEERVARPNIVPTEG